MQEKYCIDAAIWIDFLKNRKDPFTNLGECAFRLLSYLLSSNGKIIVSDVLFRELSKYRTLEEIRGVFLLFSKNLEKVPFSEKQVTEAELLAKNKKRAKRRRTPGSNCKR